MLLILSTPSIGTESVYKLTLFLVVIPRLVVEIALAKTLLSLLLWLVSTLGHCFCNSVLLPLSYFLFNVYPDLLLIHTTNQCSLKIIQLVSSNMPTHFSFKLFNYCLTFVYTVSYYLFEFLHKSMLVAIHLSILWVDKPLKPS